MMAEEEETEDAEGSHSLHELCRGVFEPLRSAIQAELALLPGCQLLYDETCVTSGNLNREAVLEHIILDMTGSPAADADDVSLQRSLRRTKRLLTHSNSVLFFRLVIMVLVACMLIFTTLITWNFTRTFCARSIKNLSLALRHQILLSSLNSITFVLNQAYTLTLSLSTMHQQTLLTHGNGTWITIEDELRGINWRFLKLGKHLHSVAFLSQDGRATDFTRVGHSEYYYYVQNSTVGMNKTWYSKLVTNSANGLGIEPILRSRAGPFKESFLIDLLAQQKMMWSLDTETSDEQFVSSAVPVINPKTKRFLGMSIVTITLNDVHHYLSTIDLLGGYLFFFRSDASGSISLVSTSYTHPNGIHLDSERVLSIYIAEAATYLQSTYGTRWLLQNKTYSEDVRLHGKLFYVDTMPLENRFNFLDMFAVILVPRVSIMGEMDARSKTVVEVSVVTALAILVIGFLVICILTRRMSTEMQLRQELIRQLVAKHKAEQSSNHKTQFLANMSHEMRTPMAGIIGLLDLLACETLTPDQETSVAQIRQCATGLLALVDNVLDISAVEAGKMELELSAFKLSEEVESLVDMFAAQSLGSNIDFTIDFSDDIPIVVKGDVTRVRQIFTNLLSNASKFTKSGHILVRGWIDQSLLTLSRKSTGSSFQEVGDGSRGLGIQCSRSSMGTKSHRESEKVALAFEIDDTGCGIPATLQESVFERFVQADSSTTRNHGGTGLGLYIVRSLVNMMGGDVQIAPKAGPGTCVRFHLILEEATSSDGDKATFCSKRPPISLLEDGLSAFVASPLNVSEDETVPSLELLTQTHALVALPDSISKSVVVCWLQRRGLHVTSVNKWEDVLLTLNRLCKTSKTEGTPLGVSPLDNVKETALVCRDSPASPFGLPSAGSSSCVSEIISSESRRHRILALIDVALFSSNMLAVYNSKSETAMNDCELNDQNSLRNLKLLASSFQMLPAKDEVLVAWVTPPKSDPFLKRALQSLIPSVFIKRPLHSSRLRHLLFLLSEASKPHEAQSEAEGYMSSDPSTPRLTGVRSPFKGSGDGYICWNSESDVDRAMWAENECRMQKKTSKEGLPDSTLAVECKHSLLLENDIIDKDGSCNVLPLHTPRSLFQEQLLLRLSARGEITSEDSPSTPESPTSGLITPEGANSMSDGLQEVKKDIMHITDLEDECKEPVIDLKLPSQNKGTGLHMRMPPTVGPATALVSANESPSVTAPSSPLYANRAGGLESKVLGGLHILLVEDTPVLQRLVSMMLKKLGAEVTVVSDGLQAVAAVTRSTAKLLEADEARIHGPVLDSNFDLILMDCAMPVMDGYGATKAIRESELNTERHIPIVALTAHALASDEERCLAVGMDAYLTKPINCKQLVSTVKKLVLREDPYV